MHVYIHAARSRDSFQNAYVHRLQTALGTPYFGTVMSELESDSRISHEELVQIAKEFFAPIAPSSSKTKVLNHIRSRHTKLMQFKNEGQHWGSRSAS